MIDVHELVKRLKALSSELDGRTPTLREFVASGISKRKIVKHKYSELCKMAGLEINKHAAITEPIEVSIRPPKILYFDAELSHMLVKTYQLKTDYIPHKNIVKNWHFLSWAGVFEHEPTKDYYLDQRYAPDKSDDRQLIEGAHHILSEADIWCGHNFKRFDRKKFNTRAALYGLPPIPEKIIWDTLIFFRRHFDLPSYSLGFICKYFKLGEQKIEHSPDMWDKCIEGDMDAWEENRVYNICDNHATRAALHFVAPYEKEINLQAFYQSQVCICGSTHFFKDGFRHTRQGKFQIFRCHACSKTFTAKENLIDKDMRSRFTK